MPCTIFHDEIIPFPEIPDTGINKKKKERTNNKTYLSQFDNVSVVPEIFS